MKIKMYILPIIIIIVLVVIFALWHYVISIYEVKVEADPAYLYSDSKSVTTVKAIPVNAFGFKAPFRKSPARFEIIEGKDLVKILSENEEEGILQIQAKETEGKVSVQFKSEFSLMPTLIEIPVKNISGAE